MLCRIARYSAFAKDRTGGFKYEWRLAGISLAKPSIKTANDLLSHPTLCLHVQPCRAYPHPWKVLLSCSICCSQVQCELRHSSIKW